MLCHHCDISATGLGEFWGRVEGWAPLTELPVSLAANDGRSFSPIIIVAADVLWYDPSESQPQPISRPEKY
jgi:hypothetical protein